MLPFSQVLHLGAKIRGNRNEIYQANLDLTKRLINFCKSQNAKLIFLSSINVRLNQLNTYAQSKLDAENMIIKSGINYQIIRPTYLFAPNFEVNLVNLERAIGILKWTPYIPQLPFDAIVQPLAVEDLIHLLLKLLNQNYPNSIWEIAGPKKRDVQEMIHSYLRFRGISFKTLKLYSWTRPLLKIITGKALTFFFQDKSIIGKEKGIIKKLGSIKQPF